MMGLGLLVCKLLGWVIGCLADHRGVSQVGGSLPVRVLLGMGHRGDGLARGGGCLVLSQADADLVWESLDLPRQGNLPPRPQIHLPGEPDRTFAPR